jgi:hypothetical protein
MLPQENRLFGCARPEPSQGSVPAGLALASDFSFCFQYKVGSSLVLRRPIEITAFTRHYDSFSAQVTFAVARVSSCTFSLIRFA